MPEPADFGAQTTRSPENKDRPKQIPSRVNQASTNRPELVRLSTRCHLPVPSTCAKYRTARAIEPMMIPISTTMAHVSAALRRNSADLFSVGSRAVSRITSSSASSKSSDSRRLTRLRLPVSSAHARSLLRGLLPHCRFIPPLSRAVPDDESSSTDPEHPAPRPRPLHSSFSTSSFHGACAYGRTQSASPDLAIAIALPFHMKKIFRGQARAGGHFFRCRPPYGMTEAYKFSNARQARASESNLRILFSTLPPVPVPQRPPSRRTPARRRWRKGLPHGHVGPRDGSRTQAPTRP
eukprot:scaffold13123_cov112-Isochrysis_galbana.AAC.5